MLLGPEGYVADFWTSGIICYTGVVLGVNINQCLRAGELTYILMFTVIFLSGGFFLVFAALYDYSEMNELQGTFNFVSTYPVVILSTIATTFAVVHIEFTWKIVQIELQP